MVAHTPLWQLAVDKIKIRLKIHKSDSEMENLLFKKNQWIYIIF